MNRSDNTIEYARRVRRRRQRDLRWSDVVAVVCFVGALLSGGSAFLQTQHRPLTALRLRYEEARVTAQATRPSYVPPPFVGRSFEPVSPWSIAETYVAIGLGTAGVVLIGVSTRRVGADR